MHRLLGCCWKGSSKVHPGTVENRQPPSSHESVPDAPAATIEKDGKMSWIHRLFGHPIKQQRKSRTKQQPDSTPRRQKGVTHEEEVEEKNLPVEDKEALPVVPKEKAEDAFSKHTIIQVAPAPKQQPGSTPRTRGGEQKKKEDAASTKKTTAQQQVQCFGFPNPAQICYMNSSLQSLLTLVDFIEAISCQEPVWSLLPEAAIMRSLTAIRRYHSSSDVRLKIRLLSAFKRAVADWAPEFQDLQQKDAHEFLTSVLDLMRSLGSRLQVFAASMDRVYVCPVEDQMVFKMQNTRTCRSCGVGSTREEVYTNLSLDLLPGGGTVEEMLQDYLQVKDLEYHCNCGGISSGQHLAFSTLPKVLVLHLKRFRFTPLYEIKKVCDPVVLLRELVVSSDQVGACYNLVSTISHIGSSDNSGHYICDGEDVDMGLEDRWFTYNDKQVIETTGGSVCEEQQEEAYILLYRQWQ